jgi:signal transduction histidine kinase
MDLSAPSYALLDYISTGICIIDKKYRVQFWNEFMEEYTGIDKLQIQGNILYDFFTAFNDEIFRERIDNIFIGWPPVILSSRLHNPFFVSKTEENKSRFQEITITPFHSPENDEYYAVITIQDVSDLSIKLEEQNGLFRSAREEIETRKLVEEKLKKSELRLQELNTSKDKFFSIIGHDLRSPFSTILGFSELIIQSVQQKDFEKVDQYGLYIYKASEKAFALLNNLLEWSRLQTGRITFNPKWFKLEHATDEIIDILLSSAKRKEINIISEIHPELQIYADRNMISTILRNLVSNAIKYTPNNGEIRLTAIKSENQVMFSVSDTGIGIEKENINKLFRIDINYTTQGTADESGTGLGLILCKEFIDRHNGTIKVESENEKGSRFIVTLPQ